MRAEMMKAAAVLRKHLYNNRTHGDGKGGAVPPYENIGKEFEIDSPKELEIIIKHDLDFQKIIRSRKITLPVLEQLGINNDAIRLIVHYKRNLYLIRKIDSILKAARDNKIYPIFNPIKSSYGQLTSVSPDLFYNDENDAIKNCFNKSFSTYFRDKQKTYNLLYESVSFSLSLQEGLHIYKPRSSFFYQPR